MGRETNYQEETNNFKSRSVKKCTVVTTLEIGAEGLRFSRLIGNCAQHLDLTNVLNTDAYLGGGWVTPVRALGLVQKDCSSTYFLFKM